MMLMRLLIILLFAASGFAQPAYDAGDWTSYRDFRYARSLDAGAHDLFVATSGGVLHYELMRQRWLDPITVGYGLSESVELDDPVLLFFDEQTGYLWVATRTQVLLYDLNAEIWRRVHRDLWVPGDRVVNIGVAANDIYIETLPPAIFNGLYVPGSPIPLDIWRQSITRYKGSRTFGAFILDIDPAEPENARWRGLRTKLPISRGSLWGATSVSPFGFPLLMVVPRVWQSDGTLLDQHLRATPITDWLIDSYGRFWATFWGAGVMRGDLRSALVEFYEAGPAGRDVRSILVVSDAVWMAGFTSRDREGITCATLDLKSWKFFERRDDSSIRSTDVFDMAEWNGSVWCATDQGLLAYHKKEGEWRLFTVKDNLHSDQVRALAPSDSELWIGNSRGLCFMSLPGREIWRAESPGIELAGVNDLALCGDTLYVGTPQGLFKASVKDRRFAYAPLDPGLLNAPVVELSVSGTEIWLATPEGVQVHDQSSGTSKSWPAQIWLGESEPSCILATPAFVWVGTRQNGFYRYTRGSGQWISYTTADGLLDNHVQIIRRDGDDLLIGTASGLTRFYWNRPGRLR